MMKKYSAHFTQEEFLTSATAVKYGVENRSIDATVDAALQALVLCVLEPLRRQYGKSMKVNSGYRCPELNRLVGGASTSQHTKGEAADIATSEPYELAALAKRLNLPYDQMILYPTFVHFSHKLNGTQRRQVLYNKSYKGRKI